MKDNHIRIGSRGSKLALYQANQVSDALKRAIPEIHIEIVEVKTKGDKILDISLSKIGDKGLFTKEIEELLLADKIDIAVHSLKDLPTILPEGLKISGVLPRHEVRDALITTDNRKLNDLSSNTVIATSSLRRKSQLLAYNPDFKIIDIRGNVETRLQKLKDGYCDALVMAGAGLLRLGYDEEISELISPNNILPAVSQGIIAIESKLGRTDIEDVIAKINHQESLVIGEAERSFMHALEGGCQVPVAIYTEKIGIQVKFTGYVGSLDGVKSIKEQITGNFSETKILANELALKILKEGGEKILASIRV